MEPRKSDPRIYIITFLFLLCVISGGVLLFIDVLLPQGNPLFLTAGMVLVGVPWVFWFVAYLYRCIIKPCTAEISSGKDKNLNVDPEMGNDKKKGNIKIPGNAALESPLTPRTPREGERHVQFGSVTVIRNGEDEAAAEEEEESFMRENDDRKAVLVDQGKKGSDFSDDCDRTPLRLSTADASH